MYPHIPSSIAPGSLYPLLQRRWTDGDTSPKALVISIHDDNTFEPTEADDKPTEAESEALLEWWPTEAKKKVKCGLNQTRFWPFLKPKFFRISFKSVQRTDKWPVCNRTLCRVTGRGPSWSHARAVEISLDVHGISKFTVLHDGWMSCPCSFSQTQKTHG